jgi:hypothetical protein
MSIVIFAGPSIHGLDIQASPELIIHAPATQGDIFRACLSRPTAIGLIDGYFDSVPSVWHKEILWALSQGINVFGSASMGALRAAELDAFGMLGIGRIYEWYRDGVIEDDDEVALIHGPAETKFLPLSEPMVNVRATCEAAVAAGILQNATADAIVTVAKGIHYQDRTWDTIFSSNADSAAFATWIEKGYVDQKRLDAAMLISEISKPRPSSTSTFRFEWTNLWDSAMREWTADHVPHESDLETTANAVLNELRLDLELFDDVIAEALVRSTLLTEADRRRIAIDRRAKLKALGQLRDKLKLSRKSDLDAWVQRNVLNEERLDTMMDEDARIELVSDIPHALLQRHIIAVLQARDQYGQLAKRAIDKAKVLKDQQERTPHELSPPLMLNWFFGNRRGEETPADIDSFARNLGIASRQDFYRLLADEYVYSANRRSSDVEETG